MGLCDHRAGAKIAARIDRLALGNLGDVQRAGEGASELRIQYGRGYRVYFIKRGQRVSVLLCRGDKGTQAKDLRAAKLLAAKLED